MLATVGMRKRQPLLLQQHHGCCVGRWIDRQTDGREEAAYRLGTVLRPRGLLKQDCPNPGGSEGARSQGPLPLGLCHST